MNVAKSRGVVSARSRAHPRLSRQFLLKLIEEAPAGILLTRGPDHVVEFANLAFCRLCALESVSLGHRAAVLVPGSGLEAAALLDRVYATRSASSIDLEMSLPALGVRYLRCKAWPRPDDDGSLRGLVLLAQDITPHAAARLRLEHLTERSEVLRSIGEMATGIAHDLTNLMNPLSLQLSVLSGALEVGDTERGGRALDETRSVLQRAVETLARLKAYATGGGLTQMSPVDLVDLAREAVLIARPRMGQTMSRVVEEFADAPVVSGCASDILRALVNLLCNAIDATRGGGTITVRSGTENGGAWIEVGDDGSGMSPEVRRRAFEPFFTTKGRRGTGMGLAMVNECMVRHRGQVRLDSAPGRGTRIGLWFRADTEGARAHEVEYGT